MSWHNRRRRTKQRTGYAAAVTVAVERATAAGELRPGNYYEIPVRHTGGCALVTGKGPCDCNPEVCPPERVPYPQEN
jgi:hypothetical protein